MANLIKPAVSQRRQYRRKFETQHEALCFFRVMRHLGRTAKVEGLHVVYVVAR